jgi:serine/threonine protein kinase
VSMLFALECEDDCGRERRLTWSRGGRCVMANMATGKIPFCNDKGEQALLASLRQHKAVYAEKDALPGCPKKLLELINKCTEYEAEERPSMQAIEAELRDILESIQSGDGFGRPAPWLERGCGLDSRMRLVECGEGSIDHTMIKARVEEEMGVGKVLKVEMNVNLDLF